MPARLVPMSDTAPPFVHDLGVWTGIFMLVMLLLVGLVVAIVVAYLTRD